VRLRLGLSVLRRAVLRLSLCGLLQSLLGQRAAGDQAQESAGLGRWLLRRPRRRIRRRFPAARSADGRARAGDLPARVPELPPEDALPSRRALTLQGGDEAVGP